MDAAAYLEVMRGDLPEAAKFLGKERKLYRGFLCVPYADAAAAAAIDAAGPPAVAAGGEIGLGEWAYGWVAANRYRISRRCRLKAER